MNLNNEIAKASEIMARYGVRGEDQVAVVKILVDAGVEKCLDEQQRIRESMDAAVMKAYEGLPN
jgi:hypothetical protein